jgi:hypothetical protein
VLRDGRITVEQVSDEDKTGHRWTVLRLRRYGVHLGDFPSVEALGEVIDLSKLVDDDTAWDRPSCNG